MSGFRVLGGGSSSGAAPTVDWEPNGQALGVGVGLTMPSLELEHEKTVGVQLTMPTITASYNAQGVGIHLSGTALGAPFWQSVSTNIGSTQSGVAATKPSGTVQGDLLLAFVSIYNSTGVGDINTPSGWTSIRTDTVTSHRVRSFYKIAGASEPNSYSFSATAQQERFNIEIHRINGIDSSTPINANTGDTLLASALDPDPSAPAVTTTVNNCLVIAHLYHDHGSVNNSHTPPASHTERTDFETGGLVAIHASTSATRVFPSAGSQAAVEFNCTESTATDAVMQRIAIAPGVITLAS